MTRLTTNNPVRGRIAWTALVTLLTATALASAQQPATRPATRPATGPAAGAAADKGDEQARQAVVDVLKKYRDLKSYQDKLNVRLEIKTGPEGGKDAPDVEQYTQELMFAPPNRVLVTSPETGVYCDGKKFWLFAPTLGEYTESAAPQEIDVDQIGEALMSQEPPHLILYVLSNPKLKLDELFPMLRGFSDLKREQQDGRGVVRVRGKFDASDTPLGFGPTLVPFTLTIDEQTGVLREVQVDLTEGIRENAPEMDDEGEGRRPRDVRSAVATLTFTDVKLNADIPEERFVFKPAADVKKVDEFDWEAAMRGPSPEDFLGRPAPAFSGKTLDGADFSLAAQKGKVVVLDFWATWCVPCVKALPQIQKVHEKFKGQSVVVMGVNSDNKEKHGKARDLAKEKKLTFAHFADVESKVGRSFNISAIPCTILIDGQGVVQSVHVGVPAKIEEVEKMVSAEVERLLKGERLYDPAKLKNKGKEQSEAAKEQE